MSTWLTRRTLGLFLCWSGSDGCEGPVRLITPVGSGNDVSGDSYKLRSLLFDRDSCSETQSIFSSVEERVREETQSTHCTHSECVLFSSFRLFISDSKFSLNFFCVFWSHLNRILRVEGEKKKGILKLPICSSLFFFFFLVLCFLLFCTGELIPLIPFQFCHFSLWSIT